MSYTKQTWQNGDTITAEKLNHMEDGIASTGGVINVIETHENDTSTLGNTWKEIKDAIDAGYVAYILYTGLDINDYAIITNIISSNDSYQVSSEAHTWTTDSENGYPSYYYGD